MKKIEFFETTLTSNASFSFKEKIEIARRLDRMRRTLSRSAPVENERTDTLFVRTASALVKNTTLSIGVGYTERGRTRPHRARESEKGATASKSPASPDPDGIRVSQRSRRRRFEAIAVLVSEVPLIRQRHRIRRGRCNARRGGILREAIKCAIESGATRVCVCDSAAAPSLPEIFRIPSSPRSAPTFPDCRDPLGVQASGELGMAESSCVAAFRAGADYVRASVTDKRSRPSRCSRTSSVRRATRSAYPQTSTRPSLRDLQQIRRIAQAAARAMTDARTEVRRSPNSR